MFFDEDFMIIKKILVERMYKRLIQRVTLKSPLTDSIYTFGVNHRIDLTKFEKGQKVKIKFKLFKRWNTNGAEITITSIEVIE